MRQCHLLLHLLLGNLVKSYILSINTFNSVVANGDFDVYRPKYSTTDLGLPKVFCKYNHLNTNKYEKSSYQFFAILEHI
jgi:hypothetical protein